jgi:two-component system nitrogen regulation sensor histidine kinase GlnL
MLLLEGKRVLNRNLTQITLDLDAVLNAIPSVVIVVETGGTLLFLNSAGEQFFQNTTSNLCGTRLDHLIAPDNPIFSLIRQASTGNHSVAEYQVTLGNPRIGHHTVNILAAPLGDPAYAVVITIQERSLAAKIDRQLTHRGAARSVSGMAAMLAHEIKNPLAGIRGAAQLLEQSVRAEDRSLTRLIQDESDRVCSLVDRMEVFSAGGPLHREAVNIHEVLTRVRTLAENSFARHVRFVEQYDPSLPPVDGNRDQLVQVFLNLVKNAAEAAPREGGEIVVGTAYCHGVRLAVSGNRARIHLPLMVTVQDNGEGIPDDIKPYLFEPFITSKAKGSGLGLALVAKIIGDHGGIVECETAARRTVFRVLLPIVAGEE